MTEPKLECYETGKTQVVELKWKCHETIGLGVVNAKAVLRAELKGWPRLYRDILKYGHKVVIRESDDEGRFVIETYKEGSSYWCCKHMLSPNKQIELIKK